MCQILNAVRNLWCLVKKKKRSIYGFLGFLLNWFNGQCAGYVLFFGKNVAIKYFTLWHFIAMAGHPNSDISYRAVQTLLHLFEKLRGCKSSKSQVVIRRNLKITFKNTDVQLWYLFMGSRPFWLMFFFFFSSRHYSNSSFKTESLNFKLYFIAVRPYKYTEQLFVGSPCLRLYPRHLQLCPRALW